MPKIQQLSPHIADLIAAGEVVERPASAAKELVENAIDAGAKNITVELQNGGMTFLRVTDDGCGIAAEDAETAFLRHATSKLHAASDLEAIRTLGFRGEALAAISSVSRIDLLTKTADAPFGTSLHLEAGEVMERGEAGCPDGTTIIVRDLFYNTPARMKFMKRDSVEASALLSMVQRLAVAHPEVSVRVIRDGQEQLHTSGDGQLLSAVYAVLGRQTAQDMAPVDSRWEKNTLTGYVSKPSSTRGTRANQLFFVNGRHVRSKMLTTALEEAYRNQLLVGRYPSCVLHLHLPEHLVDVNVHPAKTEIKFLNEREIFDCIHYGVMGALEQASGRVQMQMPRQSVHSAPKKDFYRTMTPEEYRAFAEVVKDTPRVQPAKAVLESLAERHDSGLLASPKRVEPVAQKRVESPVVHTLQCQSVDIGIPECAVTKNAGNLLHRDAECAATGTPSDRQFAGSIVSGLPESADERAEAPETVPQMIDDAPVQQEIPLPEVSYRIVGEVLDTYIIVEQNRTMLLIDKHAAHERILFEKYRKQTEPVLPQLLLEPVLCEPEREETAVLLENETLLAEFGFAISDYGGGTLAIRQIPSDIAPDDAASSLTAMAGDLLVGKHTAPSDLRDRILHTIACKAAIKGGWHTDPKEREAVVREVLTRDDLKYCPHGRPICVEMTASQLERQFKRT